MNSIETIPQLWDDERDDQFFRITQSLFAPSYCYGAGVLLASYDPEDEFVVTPTSAPTCVTPPAEAIDTTSPSNAR